jgi:hypothetical protein
MSMSSAIKGVMRWKILNREETMPGTGPSIQAKWELLLHSMKP